MTGSMIQDDGMRTKAQVYRIASAGKDTWLPSAIEHVRDLPDEYLNQYSFVYLENPDLILVVSGSN